MNRRASSLAFHAIVEAVEVSAVSHHPSLRVVCTSTNTINTSEPGPSHTLLALDTLQGLRRLRRLRR